MGSRLSFSKISIFQEFVVPYNEWKWLGNTKIFGKNIEYLNLCIGISMAKKFSNFCLVWSNGMLLVQYALRLIRRELDQGVGTYSEGKCEDCAFFNIPSGRHWMKEKHPILWEKHEYWCFWLFSYHRLVLLNLSITREICWKTSVSTIY